MRTGSAMNHLMGEAAGDVPVVGTGCTRLGWSDRHPYTVVLVLSPTRIVVQEDRATRVDSNGMSESQEYAFAPNPDGPTRTVTKRKNGAWVEMGESMANGTRYLIGFRKKYHDYSF